MLRTEIIKAFDTDGRIKKEINESIKSLHQFRKKYPLTKLNFIDKLTADDLYKKGEDYFFRWIQRRLSALGRIGIGSDRAFLGACEKLVDFKELLRIAVAST